MTDERDPGASPVVQAGGEMGVDHGDRLHEFRGDAITVTWSRRRCTHVAACIMNLPAVFEPGRRPWVDVAKGSAEAIARVVPHCPTGALHFHRTDGGAAEPVPASNAVAVTRDGPINVRGDLEIYDESGELRLRDTRAALCRCGQSANRPFCDGAHHATGFRDGGVVGGPGSLVDNGAPDTKLRVRPESGGPLRLDGPFTMAGTDRRTILSGTQAALCRCGRSRAKPFCDGSHLPPHTRASQRDEG